MLAITSQCTSGKVFRVVVGGSGWQWVAVGGSGWWLVVGDEQLEVLRVLAFLTMRLCTTSHLFSVFYSALERDWPWLSHVQSLLQVECAEPAAVQSPGNPAFKCPSFKRSPKQRLPKHTLPKQKLPKQRLPTKKIAF